MSEKVPEGWKKFKLGELGKFSTSSVDKKSSADEDTVHLLNYMDVYQNSRLDESFQFQQVTAPEKQVEASLVKNGDVFFTPSSETPDDIGHSAVFIGNLKNLVHSYHTVRFRPTSEGILDNEFKAYAFKSETTYEYFRRRATGSTRFTVSLPVFQDLSVLIPHLPEQKKIASILASVDEVIENTQAQIDKLQDLKKATMNELLTKGIGHTEFKDSELGRIPKSWKVVELENFCDKIGDGLHSTPIYSAGESYHFINGNNLKNGKIYIYSDTKTVSEEEYAKHFIKMDERTVLLSINGTIGNIALFQGEKVILGKSAAYLNSSESINRTFLYYFLQSARTQKYFLGELTGTTIKNLSLKTIRSTSCPVPSLQEQNSISKILISIEHQVECQEEKFHQTQSLKKSLMQDLLTGKVRVKVN